MLAMLPNALKTCTSPPRSYVTNTRNNIDSLELVYVLERNTELSVAATQPAATCTSMFVCV